MLPWRRPFYQPDGHCNYCGKAGHKRAVCAALDEDKTHKVEEACSYEICFSRRHRVGACPLLHGRCCKCRLRGHNGSTCQSKPTAGHKRGFEEHADGGIGTRQRFSNPHWGFYELPELYNHETHQFHYADLIGLPTSEAMSAVGALFSATKSRQPTCYAGQLRVTVL